MKAAWSMVSGLAIMCVLALGLQADDGKKDKGKEETLKGSITCAKCDLKKADKCATVIKVTGKDGKDTVYYFDDKADKDNHKEICRAAKNGSVTGTVSEKDGKKVIKVTKVEFEKK